MCVELFSHLLFLLVKLEGSGLLAWYLFGS